MSSFREPKGSEQIASDVQPGGYHKAGETAQNLGGMVWDGSGWRPWTNASADGEATNEVPLVAPGLFNASGTFDRQRNNIYNQVAIESASRTELAQSSITTNWNHSKLHIKLVVTVKGSGTLQVSLLDNQNTVCLFVPVTGSSTFQAAPGLNNSVGGGSATTEPKPQCQSANVIVPAKFIIKVGAPSEASSWTYEVLYSLLV